jgi:hypothetical protein
MLKRTESGDLGDGLALEAEVQLCSSENDYGDLVGLHGTWVLLSGVADGDDMFRVDLESGQELHIWLEGATLSPRPTRPVHEQPREANPPRLVVEQS